MNRQQEQMVLSEMEGAEQPIKSEGLTWKQG